MSAGQLQHEIARCRREVEAIRAELLAGNPDVEGLCLALADWSAELRLLEQEALLGRSPEVATPERGEEKPPGAGPGGHGGQGLLGTVLRLAVRNPAILEPALVIGSDAAKVEAGEGVGQPQEGGIDRIVLVAPA